MKRGFSGRISGIFFLLLGLTVLLYHGVSIKSTGAVILTNQTVDFVFIFSLILIIIGGILLFKSFINR